MKEQIEQGKAIKINDALRLALLPLAIATDIVTSPLQLASPFPFVMLEEASEQIKNGCSTFPNC